MGTFVGLVILHEKIELIILGRVKNVIAHSLI